MSVYLDRADQMATLIEGLFDDGQVAVVVDRQKDITAEFNKRIGKVKGGVAVIEWLGALTANVDLDDLRVASKYSVTVITKPITRDHAGLLPIDDLVESIASALHGYNPDANHCLDSMRVISIDPVANQQFRIYIIRVEQDLQS
jgi:hypothetical protein